jgi:hypothetical protein
MNDAYKTLKDFAADGRLCIIRLEGENVIGRFIKDEFSSYIGYGFRSEICPKFIDEDNRRAGETRETGLTGFYSEVFGLAIDGDDLLVAFDEEASTYHRVYEIVAFNRNCYVHQEDDCGSEKVLTASVC